ncbi:hypothetical protein FC093_09235 [Ilyomonas limi]|uniref:Uncharacterized protein n=1 Tax=Ilyomonas limi TaxID=2575867 RepID=A0A4U3L1W2_9BACT|nr:hypothetical protein [Ilyomonas limi]TKK68870.1 hypothetical protein FC093_09235 [Ilyomonas limi]
MKSKRKSINEAGYNFIEVAHGIFEFYTQYGAAYKVEFIDSGMYFNSSHPASGFIYSIDVVLLYPGRTIL